MNGTKIANRIVAVDWSLSQVLYQQRLAGAGASGADGDAKVAAADASDGSDNESDGEESEVAAKPAKKAAKRTKTDDDAKEGTLSYFQHLHIVRRLAMSYIYPCTHDFLYVLSCY